MQVCLSQEKMLFIKYRTSCYNRLDVFSSQNNQQQSDTFIHLFFRRRYKNDILIIDRF